MFLARNAIVVIISASIAYALASQGEDDIFTLVNKLPKGIPSLKAPIINKEVLKVHRKYPVWFLHARIFMQDLNSLIVVAALIGLLESIAIGKAFG